MNNIAAQELIHKTRRLIGLQLLTGVVASWDAKQNAAPTVEP